MSGRFRIVSGQHEDKGPVIGKTKEGYPLRRPFTVSANQGDKSVFDSDDDLDVMFNQQGSIKFERMFDNMPQKLYTSMDLRRMLAEAERREGPAGTGDVGGKTGKGTVVATPRAELEKMSADELLEHAVDNEIELGGAVKKADVLKVILTAQGS